MGVINDCLHSEAVGLRLCRMDRKDNLLLYEVILFERGRTIVEMILRRAAIAGLVEVDGEIKDKFADVFTDENSFEQTVALDDDSFRYLRNTMRPRRERKSPA